MTNKLWNKMVDNTNFTKTENGAKTLKSTKSRVLDLFSMGGALRNRNKEEVKTMISQALAEDKELATKCLFYLRDVRGGQGERDIFRTGLRLIQDYYDKDIMKIALLIQEYGRWDDIFSINEEYYLPIIKMQLTADESSDSPSLLAKWLPSENASSSQTKRLARKIIKALGITPREYRQILVGIRKKLNILETTMSNSEWKILDYSKIPSRASLLYRNAFSRNDGERYVKFLESVKKGTKTINASTLYPYEIVSKVTGNPDNTLDALWKNLPNYVNENENSIVVADTSGSMRGTPLDVSISLAMYFAERNKGIFSNKFMTFSRNPTLQEVQGETLQQKVRNLSRADWDMNTDLQKVFDLVLNTAIQGDIDEDEMPKNIYIVSDMEFNSCVRNQTNFEEIREKYALAGYDIPQLIFWNVNSRNNNVPVKQDQRGTVLVSGCSPSIFKMVMEKSTPMKFMLKVLNSERYSKITF